MRLCAATDQEVGHTQAPAKRTLSIIRTHELFKDKGKHVRFSKDKIDKIDKDEELMSP